MRDANISVKLLRLTARMSLCLIVLASCAHHSRAKTQTAGTMDRVLPKSSADLVVPILDLRYKSLQECGGVGEKSRCQDGPGRDRLIARGRRIGELVAHLVEVKSLAADRAMVVLLLYDVGPSEIEDIRTALAARGKTVLPYLVKYKDSVPQIPGRDYPEGMRNGHQFEQALFGDLIESIKQGKSN